jgi:hypothetical protein
MRGDLIMRASPGRVRGWSVESEEELYLSKIRAWAAEHNDCLWLDKVEPFSWCRVAAVVRKMRLDPEASTLDVTVSDGRSTLVARWPLERSSPQMKAVPGTGVILEGTAVTDSSGAIVLVEPRCKIAGRPELN